MSAGGKGLQEERHRGKRGPVCSHAAIGIQETFVQDDGGGERTAEEERTGRVEADFHWCEEGSVERGG